MQTCHLSVLSHGLMVREVKWLALGNPLFSLSVLYIAKQKHAIHRAVAIKFVATDYQIRLRITR